MAIKVSAISWVIIMVLFAGIGFAAYKIGTIVPRNQMIEQVKQYREEAQKVVTTYSDSMNKVAKRHNDSLAILNKVIQKQDVRIGGLTKRATKAEKENIKLVNEFRVAADSAPAVCNPVISSCQKALAGKDREISIKDSTIVEMTKKDTVRLKEIATAQQSALAQMMRADSLDRTILNFPKVESKNELFGFIKVSPTNAFFGGTTIGLLLSLLIH
jgi:predicted transcriptional regulator